MLKDNRQFKILELVNKNGSIRTSELTELFQTTRQTIHNDLEDLSVDGKLKKVYGGAVRISKSEEPSMASRRIANRQAKNRIGYAASRFVMEKDTIFLDVSTTVNEMLPYLYEFDDLTIVTHSIEAAYLLSAQTDFDILMIGGHMRNKDFATEGNLVIDTLENIFVDKSFFGAGGVSLETGITDYHFTDSQIRRRLIENSSEVYVLFDSSKINTVTISKYADFKDIHRLITYNIQDHDFLRHLIEHDISYLDAKEFDEEF